MFPFHGRCRMRDLPEKGFRHRGCTEPWVRGLPMREGLLHLGGAMLEILPDRGVVIVDVLAYPCELIGDRGALLVGDRFPCDPDAASTAASRVSRGLRRRRSTAVCTPDPVGRRRSDGRSPRGPGHRSRIPYTAPRQAGSNSTTTAVHATSPCTAVVGSLIPGDRARTTTSVS